MNTRHKLGLRKPEKHKLGFRAAIQGAAAEASAVAGERILRDQFWLPPRPRTLAPIHKLPASGAPTGTLAEREKNRD